MKTIGMVTAILVFLFAACQQSDPVQEINDLVAQNKLRDAKIKYRELVEQTDNPNVWRDYIHFLYENKQYVDFDRECASYLRKYPDDVETMNLNFEYYAKLAGEAERQKDFESAMFYIVTHLLSPDFKDYRKWESRQATVLRKWFQDARDKNDITEQKKVLSEMINLKFENLAKSLAPDLYAEIASVNGGE